MESINNEIESIKIRYNVLNIIKQYNVSDTFIGLDLCSNLKRFLEFKRKSYHSKGSKIEELKTEDEKQTYNMYNKLDVLMNFLQTNIHVNNKAFTSDDFPTASKNINNNLHELEEKLSLFNYSIEFVIIMKEWISKFN